MISTTRLKFYDESGMLRESASVQELNAAVGDLPQLGDTVDNAYRVVDNFKEYFQKRLNGECLVMRFPAHTGMTLYLQNLEGTILQVDWGDGTVDNSRQHTYNLPGTSFEITREVICVVTGNITKLKNSWSGGGWFSSIGGTPSFFYSMFIPNTVTEIE
jgi:hypothetical protein